jgi:tRNA(Ile)-lysidine synthase
MALAQLLIKYGRRVGAREKIRLVHINHRWRGEESDEDERFVREAARGWKVPITIVRLKRKEGASAGSSLEEKARRARKRIFERLSKKYRAPIFTAHHADDVAETMLWRLLTGTTQTHGGGISFRHKNELRPLLRVRKSDLKAFLEEEGQTWREDRTNHEGRFLRSRMRQEAMPALEKLFPRMVDRLVEQALEAQTRGRVNSSEVLDLSLLFNAAGVSARKAHFQFLSELQSRVRAGKVRKGEWSLPESWKLSWDVSKSGQRWILERFVKK